jgi:formamidopyrimidine-DNA glycosylase
MPELPDIVIYLEALRTRVVGQRLQQIRLASPFLLRSVHPPIEETHGKNPSAFQTVLARENHTLNGRYGKPCPDCGSPVQRIVSAEDETNYCARGQTGGRLLSGRMLSRLLKSDWPRTLEQLESTRASPS